MAMDSLRIWLTALTAPAIAALGLWIAYQQFRLQRYKFRADLSEKRMAVFVAVRELLDAALSAQLPPEDALVRFRLATASAPFLFGPDVNQFLARLHSSYAKVLEISEIRQEEAFADDQERRNLLAERRDLKSWMRGQLTEAQSVFRPYLDLSAA